MWSSVTEVAIYVLVVCVVGVLDAGDHHRASLCGDGAVAGQILCLCGRFGF